MASSSDVPPLSCIEEGTQAYFPNPPGNRNPSEANEGRDRELHGQSPSSTDHSRPSERPHMPRTRQCSAVSVDYFDPEGVSTLSQSLDPIPNEETHFANSGPTIFEDVVYFDPECVSTLSRSLDPTRNEKTHSANSGPTISEDSEATLPAGSKQPLDFERILRYHLKKLVLSPISLFLLSHLLPRKDEAGIKSRELGVAFENLRVIGLGASASHQATLGSLLNPLNILSAIKNLRHPPLRDIIRGFEGVVRPGEMLCMEFL